MLVLNILPVCMSKGIRRPYSYLLKHGFPNSAASSITTGKYRQPKLEHIERLCLLLGCVPNDILHWTPGADDPTDVPLAALIHKSGNDFNWIEEIQHLPLDKLRAVSEVMEEELRKIKGA